MNSCINQIIFLVFSLCIQTSLAEIKKKCLQIQSTNCWTECQIGLTQLKETREKWKKEHPAQKKINFREEKNDSHDEKVERGNRHLHRPMTHWISNVTCTRFTAEQCKCGACLHNFQILNSCQFFSN